MLRRILQNLLVNAVQYTDKGGIRLLARRRGTNVRIEVWDTGPGIGEADREMIFEEFQRGSATDRPAIGGFGLGPVDRAAHGRGARAPDRSMLPRRPRHPLFAHRAHGRRTAARRRRPRRRPRRSISTSRRSPALRSRSSTTTPPCSTRCRGCSNAGTATFAAARNLDGLVARSGADSFRPDIILADYHLDDGRNGLDAVHALRMAVGRADPGHHHHRRSQPGDCRRGARAGLRDASEAGEAGGAAGADAASPRPRDAARADRRLVARADRRGSNRSRSWPPRSPLACARPPSACAGSPTRAPSPSSRRRRDRRRSAC